jgi:hypothetical protein
VAQPLEKLSDTVTTAFDGSPPLWVTRVQKAGSTKKEVFINNARIHEKRSNFQGTNSQNSAQVCTNEILWVGFSSLVVVLKSVLNDLIKILLKRNIQKLVFLFFSSMKNLYITT